MQNDLDGHRIPNLKHALMGAAASGLAASVALPAIRNRLDKEAAVTPKLGKHNRPYRRVIKYVRSGPFHRQTGIKWLSGECWPVMQTYFKHRFLHATKGWREYTSGTPDMRMPFTPAAFPPQMAFYGRH